MMRSLWSGVSGLNAHQVAMDVEANNIANVNTVGFKYSRTDFSNLLSQTMKSATAPQGNLGGKNSLQIGLGTSVTSVETIFKQGSIQNTDKNTDMAISGKGFFVVSPDGGKTQYYTRAGDFNFDANGSFVDPQGNVVQGWMIDQETGIKNDKLTGIKINPSLTTAAKATNEIAIKANLNSGDNVKEKAPTRGTIDPVKDLNKLFSKDGKTIKLEYESDQFTIPIDKNGDGHIDTATEIFTFTYGKNVNDSDRKFESLKDLVDEINKIIKDTTGTKESDSYKLFINGNGQLVDPSNRLKVEDSHFYLKIKDATTKNIFKNFFTALTGPSKTSDSLKFNPNVFIGTDDVGELFDENGKAINLKEGQGIIVNINGLGENRKFVYKKDPVATNSGCGGSGGSYQIADPIKSDSAEGLHWTYDSNSNRAFLNVGGKITFKFSDNSTDTYYYGKDFQTIDDLICQLNTTLQERNINSTVYFEDGKIKETNDAIKEVTAADTTGSTPSSALNNLNAIFDPLEGGTSTNTFYKKDVYYFHDIQDLSNLWQLAIDDADDKLNSPTDVKAVVRINDNGKIELKNVGTQTITTSVKGYPAEGQDNATFTTMMSTLGGISAPSSALTSQQFNAAVHTTSMDVYDSLGSKHTLTIHFRKAHTSTSPTDSTKWNWWVEVPEPATIKQPSFGSLTFNPDGSIKGVTPTNITLDPNNGAKQNQTINLNFGTLGKLDGITSFESESVTTGQSQDGFAGGDLQQLVVDQSGTIIGVFTNGRSYPLAKVALAKFANDAGLMNEGNTLFSASPNSGEAIIGGAGEGGLGTIQPSALEMSNVDLSRSLTQLIVIQRGFQANSKTITTSDQMLQTLLQLKQ